MAERIILSLSCLLCAAAFFLIGYLCRISTSPVPFWTGSELKPQVKEVAAYHRAMGRAFQTYGLSWLLAAALGAMFPPAGMAGIGLLCTLGLYLLYRSYRKTLQKCA